MGNYNINATRSTPEVILDATQNILLIRGQSYPENALSFYRPIILWIKEYLDTLVGQATLKFHMDYMNTSSTKCIMDLIYILNEAFKEGKDIRISWFYEAENEALLECGEEFKEDLAIPFDIIEI